MSYVFGVVTSGGDIELERFLLDHYLGVPKNRWVLLFIGISLDNDFPGFQSFLGLGRSRDCNRREDIRVFTFVKFS